MTPVMFRLFFFLRILGTVVLYSWSLRGSVPGQYLALIARLLPGFEIWSVILYLIHSHDIHWYTVIFYHSDRDTDPHSVVNIDQLTAICEMLLVTTLSFVWGHEINNMMSQCIYSPPQIKTGVSDDAKGDPASSTSMWGPRKNSHWTEMLIQGFPWLLLNLDPLLAARVEDSKTMGTTSARRTSRYRCAASKTYAWSGNLQAHHKLYCL